MIARYRKSIRNLIGRRATSRPSPIERTHNSEQAETELADAEQAEFTVYGQQPVADVPVAIPAIEDIQIPETPIGMLKNYHPRMQCRVLVWIHGETPGFSKLLGILDGRTGR